MKNGIFSVNIFYKTLHISERQNNRHGHDVCFYSVCKAVARLQATLLFEWDSREPLCIVTLPIETRSRQELREYAIFLCVQLTVVGYDKLTSSIHVHRANLRMSNGSCNATTFVFFSHYIPSQRTIVKSVSRVINEECCTKFRVIILFW